MNPVVGILCAFAMCGISILSGLWARSVYRLSRHGVAATARIVDSRSDTDSDGDVRYFLTVRFALPDGTEVESESGAVATRLPFGITKGGTTEIIYDPAKPTRIRVTSFEENDHRLRDAAAYLVVAVAALIGAIAFAVQGMNS
uniref:DUF3592 domain-containing protein n=1 Tax=Streptomyces sp. NBC_00093 TaxID=2975649 RepID=A0AAU2A1H7_9ACTN